jgi:hypothetical protein
MLTLTEPLNSSIKTGPCATNPSMSIHNSACNQINGTQLWEKKRHSRIIQEVTRTKLWSRLQTTDHLTKYMEEVATTMFDEAHGKWFVAKVLPMMWLVYDPCAPETNGLCPQYEQIFIVTLIEGQWLLCDCGLCHHIKGPCSHVMSFHCHSY